MGTTEADISFVSGQGECVGKTIAWKIENFSEFLKMSNEDLEENGVIFEAGHCTLHDGSRTPTKWKYYFKHTKDNSAFAFYWVGGFLKAEPEGVPVSNSAKAWCSVSLSSGGNTIDTDTPERIEFDGTSGWGCKKLITESEILREVTGDALDVTLKFFSTRCFKPVEKTPPTY